MTTPNRTTLRAKARAVVRNGYSRSSVPRPLDVFVLCPDCGIEIHADMNLDGQHGSVAARAVLIPTLVDHWYNEECKPS